MDRPQLVNEFEDMGMTISDDMIDECVITCHAFRISASDFVGSWIAYCASSQIDASDLTKERLSILVKSFNIDNKHKAHDKKYIKKEPSLNESTTMQNVNSPASLKNSRETNNIKIVHKISVDDIIDTDNIKEENALLSSGDIACDFGRGNLNNNSPSVEVKIEFETNKDVWDNFIFGRVNYQKFDSHIQDMVDDIIKNNNLKPIIPLSELCFGNDTEEITTAGSLRLIKKDLLLSSSYGYIKLDLSEAEQPIKSLFVNQILVVTGTNPDTKVFKVRKLYTDASLPLSKKLPDFSNGNMKVIVAAGPFFSELSPHGKLLKSLIQKAIEFDTKLLILLGPIFEADFGMNLNISSTESLQKCYDDVLESILKPLFSNPSTHSTKLIVLSSWKDADSLGFYPTPPNTESRLPTLYPDNVFMVSDPCVFSANDIIFAGNASDALMGLHVSAINQKQEEIFAKLAKQLVWQRCLHPSYTASPTVPVDQLLWLDYCTLQQYTPNIILTSSQLRTFIRVVEGCMVINVGQIFKQNYQKQAVSGTYGKIQISPSKNGCWSAETNIYAEVVHI